MRPLQDVRYFRHPALEGVKVCRVRHSRHVFPDHVPEGLYAIGLMEEGGSYCFGPSRPDSLVAAGQICLINPGQVHSGVPLCLV